MWPLLPPLTVFGVFPHIFPLFHLAAIVGALGVLAPEPNFPPPFVFFMLLPPVGQVDSPGLWETVAPPVGLSFAAPCESIHETLVLSPSLFAFLASTPLSRNNPSHHFCAA